MYLCYSAFFFIQNNFHLRGWNLPVLMVSFSTQSIFYIWKKTFKVPYPLHYTHQIKCSSLSSSQHSDTFLKGAKHDLYLHFFNKINEENIVIRKKVLSFSGVGLRSPTVNSRSLPLEAHAVRYGIQGLGLDVLQVCGTTNGSQQKKEDSLLIDCKLCRVKCSRLDFVNRIFQKDRARRHECKNQ